MSEWKEAMKIQLWCDDLTTRFRLEARWTEAGATMLKKSATEDPDCVVIDLRGRRALEHIARLRAERPAVDIVAFAAEFDAELFDAAHAAGANDVAAHGSIAERITRRMPRCA
jgi:DNA-binding NarL/FixJ family response regulator